MALMVETRHKPRVGDRARGSTRTRTRTRVRAKDRLGLLLVVRIALGLASKYLQQHRVRVWVGIS